MIDSELLNIKPHENPKFFTFDYEDWFHLLYAPENSEVSQWNSFESRLDFGADLIVEVSELLNVKFTVFTLGWIAKFRPELIQKLSRHGMEIASHSMTHQSFLNSNKQFLTHEIIDSKNLLEDVISKPVSGFRAPAFTVKPDDYDAFEVMCKAGYKYDASVNLSHRLGQKKNEISDLNGPYKIETDFGKLYEFPIINDNRLINIFFTGGGYFRLTPALLIKKLIENNTNKYYMTYFHSRDFDVCQPRLKSLSLLNNFRAYYGIRKTNSKILNYKKMELSGTIENWIKKYENK
jgi:polysaccharide deacetylase family protein (PEP-CTERM system associated)